MKHGTSSSDPRVLYTSDNGIDPRYSAVGMFGRAAYFAERAHYSDTGYAYDVPGSSGHRQMFLARIIAGHVDERAPDQVRASYRLLRASVL